MLAFFIPFIVFTGYWLLVERTELGKKYGFFTRQTFRSFWLVVMLFTFSTVGITGLLQIFVPNLPVKVIHRNAGSVFVVVAVFHIIVRFQHFKIIFKKIAGKM